MIVTLGPASTRNTSPLRYGEIRFTRPDSPDAADWGDRIQRGLVRITTVTRLEARLLRGRPR